MVITYVAVLIVTTIAVALLGLLASAASGEADTRVVTSVAQLITLTAFCVFIYIGVRLSFLLAPICVAEHRITLIRSWKLTRGNFWRILTILLSVFIPVLIIEFGYLYASYGSDLVPPIGRPITPEVMAQFHQHQQKLMLAASRRMQNYWYLTYPLGLLFAVVTHGSFAAQSAFAYEEVAASDLGEPRGWFAQWVSRSLGARRTAPKR